MTRQLVHLVVPDSVGDPTRPSGGNTYDQRLRAELGALGWTVRVHEVAGDWPDADGASRAALDRELASITAGALVLVDGLVACGQPEVMLPAAERLRLVVLVHLPLGLSDGPPDGRPDRQLVATRERAVLEAGVATLTTSRWTRSWLVEHYLLAADRVVVATPGVDAGDVSAGSPTGGALLCVAAVVPAKGHAALVDALATMTDLPWRLTCVGSLDLAPEHVAQLRAACAGHGIAERVVFTGPLAGADLAAAYAAADLLLLASRFETYGLVVTEALARGTPVLATRVGGVAEALGRTGAGLPGLLVAPDDPDALTAALRAWLVDEQLRHGLRLAALDRRRTLGPWSGTARTVSEVLRDVVGGLVA